jgi:hypothetical protein
LRNSRHIRSLCRLSLQNTNLSQPDGKQCCRPCTLVKLNSLPGTSQQLQYSSSRPPWLGHISKHYCLALWANQGISRPLQMMETCFRKKAWCFFRLGLPYGACCKHRSHTCSGYRSILADSKIRSLSGQVRLAILAALSNA